MFISGLLICACNNSKKVPKEKNADDNNHKVINSSDEHPESDSSYTILPHSDSSDLVITFSSRGEGINGKTVETLHSLINEFEFKYDVTIEFKIRNWGREGEKDYCFRLNNLNRKMKELFISEVKGLLKGQTLVIINENMICTKK
jgi:hypothetical protein